MERSVKQIHLEKSGRTSDKWASYLVHYDSLFAPLREAPLTLLEVGVQNGGSLETWAAYFRQARAIAGVDIDPRCGALTFADSRIRIFVGDVNTQAVYDALRAQAPQYDVIIDDGSHQSADIISTFVNYFPLLSPGGLYVVEDAHALYQAGYGGGILNESSAYALFKKLIDVLSFEFWSGELTIKALLSTFFDSQVVPQFLLDGWVDAIEFRNSIVTIRKAARPGHDKLGPRVVTGSLAEVDTAPLLVAGATPRR